MSVVDPVAGTPGQTAWATQFGATVAGVQAFLPHRQITPTSEPNTAQVEMLIANVASQVSLAIGDLDRLSGDFLADVLTNAQMLTNMGAAAWTEDAAFPERADAEDRSSWGAVLWQRFNKMLDILAKRVSLGPATPDDGPYYPDLGCAWSKPQTPLIADVGGVTAQDWSDVYGQPTSTMSPTALDGVVYGGVTADPDDGENGYGDYDEVG